MSYHYTPKYNLYDLELGLYKIPLLELAEIHIRQFPIYPVLQPKYQSFPR